MGTLINFKVSNPFRLPELRDELVGHKEVLVVVILTHSGPVHKALLILGDSNQILLGPQITVNSASKNASPTTESEVKSRTNSSAFTEPILLR